MNSLEELRKQRLELDRQIKAAEEEERQQRQSKVLNRIEGMTDKEKRLLLSMIRHDRTSCSDDNPCNGYNHSDKWFRCRKCMLMEILNNEHGGEFDFAIVTDIWRT